jgi:hypothetical protein
MSMNPSQKILPLSLLVLVLALLGASIACILLDPIMVLISPFLAYELWSCGGGFVKVLTE